MTPAVPPVYTTVFRAPENMDDSQVGKIAAYHAKVVGGNLDGSDFVVTAWKPSPEDLKALNEGGMIFLSMLNGLLPHFLTTNFNEATYGTLGLEPEKDG